MTIVLPSFRIAGVRAWAILPLLAIRLAAQTPAFSPAALAPTPPMGWASWNRFFCDYDDQTIRAQADALVKTGMRDAGYKYLIIQECIAPTRDAAGNLVVDSQRFPRGMKDLVDYIHSRGLKAGIYTDVGPNTCFAKPLYEGSYNHEAQDAAQFASWGMDLIEDDFCHKPKEETGRELYRRMQDGILKTGRPMLLYICSWGGENPWEWGGPVGQLWRTTGDISMKKNKVEWRYIIDNFDRNSRQAVFNAPGGWNDPDMLEVGNNGISLEEARAHFTMWAISAAPLWAGTDLTELTPEYLAIHMNREVIAVDQDPLGDQARKVREETPGLQVWSKILGSRVGGSRAVMLLNRNGEAAKIQVSWSDLGLEAGGARVRDLWGGADLGTLKDGYAAPVPSHGAVLIKVEGKLSLAHGITYEAEYPGNLRRNGAVLTACKECSGGYAVSLDSASATLEIPRLEAPKAGAYTIQIFGSEGGPVTLRVNGGKPAPAAATGGGPAVVSVKLVARNQLVIANAGSGAVRLDKIVVMPVRR